MLEAGLVNIEFIEDNTNMRVHLDRTKITSVGVPAIADFLNKLQVYKATADEKAGTEFYQKWTTVPEKWQTYRDIVLAKKLPQRIYVQPNTHINEQGHVQLVEYEASTVGMIQSCIERTI
jgi:dipeptidyl-peptidase-3